VRHFSHVVVNERNTFMGFRLANVAGRAVLVHGDHYTDLATHSSGMFGPDPMEALTRPDLLSELSATLGDAMVTGLLADVTLGAPVPRPQKVFGVGLNYLDHVAEGGREAPSSPLVFTKFPSCLVGPTADVEIRSEGCDYEGELVVVIGEGGRDIAISDAWNHVVGVTVGQDISDRPAQFAASPPHFDLGKSYDTFGPTGPFVVSTDDLADRDALHIVCAVNGEVRQDGTTADLIFDVPTLVSFLSGITTLVPGDLIFTGTPAGVGAAQGRYLADGDVITTTIDGVGTMTNRVVRISDPRPLGG
jgi:2,4-didehydro-3-deoxy-L-rhamnonate hydrolase